MSAIPAETLEAPTPRFRITVGNSSAVNTGMMALDWETENLPIMARVMVSHSKSAPEASTKKHNHSFLRILFVTCAEVSFLCDRVDLGVITLAKR